MITRVDKMEKYKKFFTAPLSTYYHIRQRCNDENNPAYKDYGARGIKCEWTSSKDFLKDMLPDWKKGLLIDRINNDGNYCKENCRWTTRKVQNNNKRNTWYLTFKGKTLLASEWAELMKINYHTIFTRIYDLNWSVEDALGFNKWGRKRRLPDILQPRGENGHFIKKLKSL